MPLVPSSRSDTSPLATPFLPVQPPAQVTPPTRWCLILAASALVVSLLAGALSVGAWRFRPGEGSRPSSAATSPATGSRAPTPPPSVPSQRMPGLMTDDDREQIVGMQGTIPWVELLPATGLGSWSSRTPAAWFRDQGGLVGDDQATGAGSLLWIGDGSWSDYEFEVRCTCLRGGNVVVRVRSSDAAHGYLIDVLMGLQAIAVRSIDGSQIRQLSMVDVHLVPDEAMDLRVEVRGESITTTVGGILINQLTDATWPRGGAALGVWQSHCRFERPRVRWLDGGHALGPGPGASVPATPTAGRNGF